MKPNMVAGTTIAPKIPVRSFKSYPAYKDSGVEWLGEVPEKWNAHRLKYCVDLVNDKVDGDTTDLPYTGLEHVESWTGKRIFNNGIQATSEGQANRFKSGDVLFGKLRPYLAKVLRATEEGICSGELLVMRPKAAIQDYLFNYLLAKDFITVVDGSTYGAKMPRASWEFISNLPMLLPPDDEQRAIVVFLDRETVRIDQLIGKKERQIELLQEKRSALINHAVTKGLNPQAKMKDSGIEWLGEIPKHWEVRKLKYVMDGGLVNGLFKKKEHFGSGVKLVNVFDIYRDNFLVDYNSLDRVEADEEEVKKYSVQSGDIFFVRSSLKLEGVGHSVCALEVTEPTVFECHVVRARPKKELISPQYLINFLNSVYAIHRFIELANMVTMATIDQDKINSLEIPLPSMEEQQKIIGYLYEQTITIDALSKKIENSIYKLREYRTALISAAVTGKIDVREEVA